MDSSLQDFIQGSFKSVWSLELLIFLQQHRDQAWSVDELVRELRGSGPVVRQSLAMLEAAGLAVAEADGRTRYAPASADLEQLAEATRRAYEDSPSNVRRAVLTAPNEKLHTFADAFRLKKDPE